MLRSIKGTQHLPRLLAIKVDGAAPAVLVGKSDVVLTKNGTGDYSLAPKVPFRRVPVVIATAEAADAVCELAASSASSVQILVKDPSTLAAKDAVIHVMILGYDSPDQT